MTGYTVHTGSSEDFADGWDRIFKNKKSDPKAEKQKPSKAKKKTVKKKKKTK